MDDKLELVLIPVTDVDRAKKFYLENAGFVLAARAEMAERGVAVGPVRHIVSGEWVEGPHPERENYQSFADFTDPDGNIWLLQEVNRGQG